jgi:hypothetical protein
VSGEVGGAEGKRRRRTFGASPRDLAESAVGRRDVVVVVAQEVHGIDPKVEAPHT